MRRPVIVRRLDEALTAAAATYLERLGVPLTLVKSIDVHSEVGDVQMLTVVMMVDNQVANVPDLCDVRDHITGMDPLTFNDTCPRCAP